MFLKTSETSAFIVGSGLSSLAACVYLLKEGIRPANIYIFEKHPHCRGSCIGDPENGYYLCGTNMIDRESCGPIYELLQMIPSTDKPGKSCTDEIMEFSKSHSNQTKGRMVSLTKERVDLSHLGVSLRDTTTISFLYVTNEATLDGKSISEYFTSDFFESNFWFLFSTTFGFQKDHSLIEFRRYLKRFFVDYPAHFDSSTSLKTPYNQYESILEPIEQWLKQQGVNFKYGTTVTSLSFFITEKSRSVDKLYFEETDTSKCHSVAVGEHDLVLATLGSLTSGQCIGSMSEPAILNFDEIANHSSWLLWRDIAKRQPDFGNPDVFLADSTKSAFSSFSITFKNPKYFDLILKWSGNESDCSGTLITFRDSNWLITLVLPHQPHFKDQPDNIKVCWGYGLNINNQGNYIGKKMIDCNGQEMLHELFHHLGFEDMLQEAVENCICLPAVLPMIMSPFMPRKCKDRPKVIPYLSTNFAFLGQFNEIADDVVFTAEHSVRAAQIAVYGLLQSSKTVAPMSSEAHWGPGKVIQSAWTMLH